MRGERSRSKSRARRRTQKLSQSMSLVSEQAPSKRTSSSNATLKTRQHAKQIANMVDTSFQADFGAAFGGTNNTSLFGNDEPTESTTHTGSDDFFSSDPFAPPAVSKQQQQIDVFSDPGASGDFVRVTGLSSSAKMVSRQRGRSEVSNSNHSKRTNNNMRNSTGSSSSSRPTQSSQTPPQRSRSSRDFHTSTTPSSFTTPNQKRTSMEQQRTTPTPQRTPSQRTPQQRNSATPISHNESMRSNTSNVSSSAAARRRIRTSMRQKEMITTPTKEIFPAHHDSSGSSDGLFGSSHLHNQGFSFDAFGLDGAAMDQQVETAIHDLAGSHPGLFGFDDFSDGSEGGFVDGFKVSKNSSQGGEKINSALKQTTTGLPAAVVKPSSVPTETTASLTSEENNGGGKVNVFKQAANFHKPRDKPRIPPGGHQFSQSLKMEKVSQNKKRADKTRPVLFDDNSSTEFKDPPLDADGGFGSDGGFDSDPFSPPKQQQQEKEEEEVFGTIRSRWENAPKAVPARRNVRPKPNSLPKSQIHQLQDQLGSELLSPEKLESEQFAVDWAEAEWEPPKPNNDNSYRRKNERRPSPRQQKMEMVPSSPRRSPRRRQSSSRMEQQQQRGVSKSDGGAAVRHSGVDAAMARIQQMEAHSDVGKSPSFRGVQLRKTGYSFESNDDAKEPPKTPTRRSPQKKNGFESQAMRLVRQSLDESSPVHNISSPKRSSPEQRQSPRRQDASFEFHNETSPTTRPQSSSPKKPMSYRERRELELKQQRQEQEAVRQSQPQEAPKANVAELIRKRVAASKKNEATNVPPPPSSPSRHDTRREHRPVRSRNETPVSPPRQEPQEVFRQQVEEKPKPAGKVQASGAVAHMLMMQQIQRRPPQAEAHNPTNVSSQPRDLRVTASGSHDSGDHHQRTTPKATKMMLNAFLHGRQSVGSTDGPDGPKSGSPERVDATEPEKPTFPALKDDPAYTRYFKMLSMGLPMEVVKHAMTRDGLDPSVMDGDHSKPVGIPLKDDPEYAKYFRMLKIGLHLEAVKHAMERDGLDSSVMDRDHNLPARKSSNAIKEEPKEQDSHRRARLHWKPLRQVTSNSLWAQIDQDTDLDIEIDEAEFQELFQADKNRSSKATTAKTTAKRTTSVCVIDPKRANNGGIILARLKMSHDDMADAVDRIDEQALNPEQIEHIVEYLPTKEERKALENYMLVGGQDAAEKFDALCECEKFMVSMMTVKHAKRKVSALLFRLRFENVIRDIHKDASAIENACEELISSQRLKTLLGIVLTFGNRLNTAGNGKRKAGAFTLDSLLKLRQAKAFDKKTTFLHYIVLIVQRNNKDLLDFKEDLKAVFAADKVFWDQCVADLEDVENQLENVRKIALYQAKQALSYRFRRSKKRDDEDEDLTDNEESMTLEEEVEALRATPIGVFALSAIKYVSALRDKVEGTKEKFARLLEYFGEQESEMQPHELFSTMVTFSRDFDKARDEVEEQEKKKLREEKRRLSASQRMTPGKSPRGMLRASNHQPSMGSVLKELKSSPVPLRRTSSDVPTATPEPQPRTTPQKARSEVFGRTSPRRASPGFNQTPPTKTLSQRPETYQTPDNSRSRDGPPQTDDGMSFGRRTSPQLKTRSPPAKNGNWPNAISSDQPPARPRSSPSSFSMTAMRAKARMRRSRGPQPDQPLAQPSRSPQSTSVDAPGSPSRRPSQSATSPRSPRSPDDGDDRPPTNSRSLRLQRRAEYRNRIRRSIGTGS